MTFRWPVLILWGLLLLLAGCGRHETLVEIGDRTQELRFATGDEPGDLDPQITTSLNEGYVEIALFEGLVTGDPKENDPRPGVAQTWDISPDGKIYTFHLRSDAKWSNGDPITAHDFVEAYHRILLPSLASQYSYMLYPVTNAEEFNLGKITNFDEVGFKALDDHTLRVVLHSPTPYLLAMMIHQSWYPVPVKVIEKYGPIDDVSNPWTRPGHLVGNGPFVLTEWRMNSRIIAVKNTNYWDADHVRLHAIFFDPTASLDTQERMFRSGQLHITSQVMPSKIALYEKTRPSLISISPVLGIYYYAFNVTRPPLNDVRVRKALAMAIDRQAITETITRGGEMPAFCLTPPDTAGFTATNQLREDPAEARKLLAEAGFPNGQGFPEIEVLFNTLQSHKAIAEAIQEMWKKNLNIHVRLHNEEWKVCLETLHHTNYDIGRTSWYGDYDDPSTFMELFITGGGNNPTGWSNARFDQDCDAASDTGVQAKRFAAYQDANNILIKDVPFIPIYYYTISRLIRPGINGWYPNLLDQHNFKYIWLDTNGG